MSAAIGTTVSGQSPFQTEWTLLRVDHHNVLLQGPSMVTEAALRQLHPHIRTPIASHQAPAPFELPDGEIGALILREVGALTASDQKRLLSWIVDSGSSTQIVSTTACQLFELVASGRFDDELYYRLNVLLLPLADSITA